MPRPEILARIRDLLTSLLLVVAVSLAWPAMNATYAMSGSSVPHHLASVDAHGTSHGHANQDATPVCSPDLGCCVMTHCHPGVAQPSLPMPHAALFPQHLPADPADEAGIDPAILVPPPRSLLG